MKKVLLTLFICLGLAAISFGAVSARPAAAAESGPQLFMPAAIYPVSSDEDFSAYEQYLDLEAPSDLAFCADYAAIADKPASGNSCIYILHKGTSPQYVRYEHSGTNTLSGLNFYHASDGKTYLFFFGAIGTVSWVDCEDPASYGTVETSITPYSMLISGTVVYYTQANDTYSDVYCSSISETENGFSIPAPAAPIRPDMSGSTAFSEYNGTVYIANGKQIYRCSSDGLTPEYQVALNNVESFAVTANDERKLVYIGAGNIYIDDDRTVTGDYSVVRLYGDFIYIIDGDRIVQYDLASYSFTDYMIGKYSDYPNRLGAANDISVYADKVVISDPDHARVTVYDGTFSQFRTEYPSALVCAGEEYFLAVSGTVATVYSYDRTLVRTFSLDGAAAGAAYSFGTFYLVTANGTHTYAIDCGSMELRSGSPNVTSPKSLSADLQGNLYVLTSNGQVNRYTAEQFLSAGTVSPERMTEFGDGVSDLFVDPLGNIYALAENAVFAGSQQSASPLDFTDTVYGGADMKAVAFAYEFESGTLYILSDGFAVTADLGENAPAALRKISSAELQSALGSDAPETAPQSVLVNVPAGSVLLTLGSANLAASNAPAMLSYTQYTRSEEARVGVRICTLEAGTVVAFYRYDADHSFDVTYPDGTQNTVTATLRDYSLCLVLDTQLAGAGSYTEQSSSAYLSNSVGLYRFPLLSLLTERDADNPLQTNEHPVTTARLAKGERVNVLGTLALPAPDGGWGLDADAYAFVECGGLYGFVPESYLIPAGEAQLTGSTEYIWRNLARGESVTLVNVADASDTLTLSSRELLRVLTEPDEKGIVTVSFTADGKEYRGQIDHTLLEHPTSTLAITMMVIIPLVAAAVLLSGCYLIFRKQPTLQ